MSNYNGNIEKRKAAQDLMKNRRENTSKYFFDLSKLTFAALVLGVGSALLNRWEDTRDIMLWPPIFWYSLFTGMFIVTVFALIGYKLLK